MSDSYLRSSTTWALPIIRSSSSRPTTGLKMTWPDGGNTPFRGEKATNWEGAFRVPIVMRWPGTIKPGTIYNDIFSHYDLLPTFAAAGGDPDIVGKCLRGAQIGSKTFKVHLDGFDLTPFFKGEVKEAPRKGFLYWNDDGALVAVRIQDWKIDFKAQEHKGADIWKREFTNLRAPSCSISVPIHSSAGMSRCCTTSGDWTESSSSCRRKP